MLPFLFLTILILYSECSRDNKTKQVVRYLLYGYIASITFPSYLENSTASIVIGYFSYIIPFLFILQDKNINILAKVGSTVLIIATSFIYYATYNFILYEHHMLSWLNDYSQVVIRETTLLIIFSLSQFDEDIKHKDRWLRRGCSSLLILEILLV